MDNFEACCKCEPMPVVAIHSKISMHRHEPTGKEYCSIVTPPPYCAQCGKKWKPFVKPVGRPPKNAGSERTNAVTRPAS